MSTELSTLLAEVRGCRICEAHLPLGPRPMLQMATGGARLIITGQAPGRKVHESGVPWQDASGDHLKAWLQVDESTFYDPAQVAILPMGFCFPGKKGSGDAPPRPECAPRWHPALLEHLGRRPLMLLVGQYAQRYYLGGRRKKSLTSTVRSFSDYLPSYFPLPHPSWRSRIWMTKNPWFEEEVLPELRAQTRAALRS